MSSDTDLTSARSASALATREALLEAALTVFTEHTYAGTAVPMVAERAGVAVGTIYRHFPSKQALGNAVYQRWKGRLLARLAEPADAADPEEPARVAFTRMWSVLHGFATAHPEAFAFLEYQQHAGYLDEQSRRLTERSTALATAMIKRGQRRGEIRAGDPVALVALAYGAFIGLAKAAWSGAPVDAEGFRSAEAAVWDMLRA